VDLGAYLADEVERVDGALERLLPAASAWPRRLHEAMRYAVFGGGKRLRPILVRAACRAAGGEVERALEPACAVELIHTYSLVHDDLPALDDDTLRRGRATVHVAFDEPLAIMVGDALLTEGFAVLAAYPAGAEAATVRAEACRLVATAVGSRGMVGGQVEDLEATGGGRDAQRLERIHSAKTGALLAAAVELGALLAGAAGATRDAYRHFGQRLGLLFQVADDILDVTGTAESLGKSPGKDVAAGKLTYPGVYGLGAAREELARLLVAVETEAAALEGEGGVLAAVARFCARRDH
jgi:geranylgeranyl pyrophosphate synthase